MASVASGIVRDRARGFSWSEIARRHRVSEEEARAVWEERCARTAVCASPGPLALAAELELGLDVQLEDLAVLAETALDDGMRLAALKQWHRVRLDKQELFRAMGLVPLDLGWYRTRIDLEALMERLEHVLIEHEAPVETIQALMMAAKETMETPAGEPSTTDLAD